MNCYTVSKKEMDKIEKDFAKTVIGQKARIPIILSIMFMAVWLCVTASLVFIECLCMKWAYMNNMPDISFFSSEPMSYFISFLLVVLMCLFSYFNYNKELRKYIESV